MIERSLKKKLDTGKHGSEHFMTKNDTSLNPSISENFYSRPLIGLYGVYLDFTNHFQEKINFIYLAFYKKGEKKFLILLYGENKLQLQKKENIIIIAKNPLIKKTTFFKKIIKSGQPLKMWVF